MRLLFHFVVEFSDSKKLPQQYEMVQVCKTCYLIYHAIDGERFQASRSTSKAAARLYNAKVQSSIENSVFEAAAAETARRPTSPVLKTATRAWEHDNKTEGSTRGLGSGSSPLTKQTSSRPASASSRLATTTLG